MPAMYYYDDKVLLTIEASVTSGGIILILEDSAGDLTLLEDSELHDEFALSTTVLNVVLQVKDSASHTMTVYTPNEGNNQWTKSGSVSQRSEPVPPGGDTVQVDVFIVARDVTGAVVGRRKQIVKIKHKSTP